MSNYPTTRRYDCHSVIGDLTAVKELQPSRCNLRLTPQMEGSMRATLKFALLFIALLLATAAGADSKFEKAFDGKTLDGWMLVGGAGPGYVVKDGILLCPKDGGGNLITTKQYTDFAFKFDYRLEPGGNNGIGVRTPTEGNLSYTGMEVQVLDD